jgi:copper chaperone CopZ
MAIPGVREVKTRLWRKRVRVRYEPSRISTEQIKHALGAAGFTAVEE